MLISTFLNSERQLRNGWWILLFFFGLASLLVPTLLIAQQHEMDVSISWQATIILIVSILCQLLRQKPLAELLGNFDVCWLKELLLGILLGSALMLIPAFILGIFGWVDWRWSPMDLSVLASSASLFAGVAVAEELLFRGFVFQRLISGLGMWPAQLITAAFFLLSHVNNPGMTGSTKVMAGINIFLASIMFGLAFVRTKSLAVPLGLHWMANWVQGAILGLAVSGSEQSGLLKPVFGNAPVWLTGGQFGLEASLPGLLCVLIILLMLFMRKPTSHR
ncbi:MAG TPA: CPBP family intramembrane glutamic endopeptidase [Anaerolineales bacterium]|nr:CPBP family intramembrane glutamic endopeptidase [Anaerolineales bacterium]